MAGFNIAEFSTKINQRGTLQTNKFLVQITPPLIASLNSYNLNPTLQFRASSVSIPGVDFKVISTYRYGIGPEQKTPTNVNFSDITISFIEDKQNSIWKFFTTWMDYIFKFQPGRNGAPSAGISYLTEYKEKYIAPVKILIYDNAGNNINTILLSEAYPISLKNIELSWGEQSELMRINVTFTFREWYFDARRLEGVVQVGAVTPVPPVRQTTQVVPIPANQLIRDVQTNRVAINQAAQFSTNLPG